MTERRFAQVQQASDFDVDMAHSRYSECMYYFRETNRIWSILALLGNILHVMTLQEVIKVLLLSDQIAARR